METNDELDKQIKKVLKSLDEAVENSRKYHAIHEIPGPTRLWDLFEVSIASDTVSLLEAEFEILLAKRYKPGRWEEAIKSFENKAKILRRNIEHAKKRELPPWD